MSSKAFQRFSQRLISYETDLELADLLTKSFLRHASDNRMLCELLEGQAEFHPRLQACPNTEQSRKIVGLHLKSTINVAFVKELYEDFSEFLATSLARAALAGVDAARFAGEAKLELSAKEILQTGSWESATKLISDKIFRSFENERNTRILITKMSARVGLQLDENILSAAMPYLDARHILVHRDGKPDDLYRRTYPQISVVKGQISITFTFVTRARQMVRALAEHIDTRMIEANLVRRLDMAGQR